MDIKLMKLKCGDLIISRVTEKDDTLTLEKPVQITGGTIHNWIIGDDNPAQMYLVNREEDVLIITAPEKELVQKYMELTSGIIVPARGK